jgi:hypothetical protein
MNQALYAHMNNKRKMKKKKMPFKLEIIDLQVYPLNISNLSVECSL